MPSDKERIQRLVAIEAEASRQQHDQFSSGIGSMCRSSLAAIRLVRKGTWTLDDMERWLKSVLVQDAAYCKTQADNLAKQGEPKQQ